MTSKIFRSTIAVAAVVLLCCLSIVMGFFYNYFDGIQMNQLRDELSLAAISTERSGIDFLSAVESERFRLTWVAADGTVLYDTHASASGMENHAGREEITEAFATGYGSSTRHSSTLTEQTIYEAKRLCDGTVLRISISRATLAVLALDVLPPIVIIMIIAIALSAFLARRMSRKIVEPLNRLDLEHPLENDTYEEISPLLSRINQQHLQIRSQMRKLTQKSDEFQQIIANMSEGLVLLDKQSKVLSINPAAKKLFDADDNCIGRDFITVDRRQDIGAALERALSHGHSEVRGTRSGRQFQFVLSRIESGGSVIGTVVLAFDVTEQINAERTRREFSANVSHELKTPLQSIIGSTELIENGLVKPEDMPRFVGHIRKEAARLVTLIEDIIRLSQLDEGAEIPLEEVEILELGEEVAAILQTAARQRNVTIQVSGQPRVIQGVRRLLYEILYNLCDNAVKYNVEGGSVTVRVSPEGAHTVVTVSDTGIGIPAEHQSRVFERFYRVDKSHSKLSGGTGLGLSIVKHAVQFHHGTLELQSAPGRGTVITIVFP